MKSKEIVSYIRVSTEGQHKSGLGEDAQRRALGEFAAQHGLEIAASYSDTASGAAPLTKRPGLAAAILASRALANFLYETSPHDPWILFVSVSALAAVGSAASLLPAIRAARIEPITAIRCE